jgi:hypothetical protein
MIESDFASGSLDFSKLIADRTKDFVGLAQPPKPDGAAKFLLTGGPGTGKTAIAARIAQMHLGQAETGSQSQLSRDSLSYFHFCQAGLDSTLSPLTFVQSLAQALANRYPIYLDALRQQSSQQFVINSVVNATGSIASGAQVAGVAIRIELRGGDARPLFDQLVRRPLRALCDSGPQAAIVILIDSLDEALSFNPDNNIAQLLSLVQDFKDPVRFILTSRSNNQRVLDLVGAPTLDLIANAPANVDEVGEYAAARLAGLPEQARRQLAARIAAKSGGNFLYAYYVLNEITQDGRSALEADSLDLPDGLDDVYRTWFVNRGADAGSPQWKDVYRPVLGTIAVARGEGLSRLAVAAITGLAEERTDDAMKLCRQYLVGGEGGNPYRIYHESFREFLLDDKQFTVYPAERHAAIARYLQDKYGTNWGRCNDAYALRYTPLHWAEAATISEFQRGTRTQSLVDLAVNPKFQRRFEQSGVADLPALREHLHRAVAVAALNDGDDMLSWLIKAAQGFVRFRRDYLKADAVVQLAREGELEQAEARLSLFNDIGEDWYIAALAIVASIGAERNPSGAEQLRARIAQMPAPVTPLKWLSEWLAAAVGQPSSFTVSIGQALSLTLAQELVKRISGQVFDTELLQRVNPSLISVMPSGPGAEPFLTAAPPGPELQAVAQRGYAAALDAPILVDVARRYDAEGTELVDRYIDAHAGYTYVEYRNRSLWFVLQAVIGRHPQLNWVNARLARILVAALSGGGVDFREMLPLTAKLLSERASGAGAYNALQDRRFEALHAIDHAQTDSWASHKRRITALMELQQLLFHDERGADELLARIKKLPDGFAGFQAPAYLRLADAVRACGMNAQGLLEQTLEESLRFAHHIQDYHFCARMTARCNALKRWHETLLTGKELAGVTRRLAAFGDDGEFAADHVIREPYRYRYDNDLDILPITSARDAQTLEQLGEVFQRPSGEFTRLNPQYGLTQTLDDNTRIRIPDPGLAPQLAMHFAARTFSDPSLDGERAALVRTLVPIAAGNPTALDTVLSYLLIATDPDDPELLEAIVREAGAPQAFADVAVPAAQIGPDAAIPT